MVGQAGPALLFLSVSSIRRVVVLYRIVINSVDTALSLVCGTEYGIVRAKIEFGTNDYQIICSDVAHVSRSVCFMATLRRDQHYYSSAGDKLRCAFLCDRD